MPVTGVSRKQIQGKKEWGSDAKKDTHDTSMMSLDRLTSSQIYPLSPTSAEPNGYLAATQTRDGRIQLISSKNHYAFNLAWVKTLPP